MNKIYLLLFTLLSTFFVDAQIKNFEKLEAIQLVKTNQREIGLTNADLNNFTVSSTYNNKFAGSIMVYIQQTYNDIPVYNQLQTLAFKNGKLISKSGSFISNIEKFIKQQSSTASVKADDAVMAAIADRKLVTKDLPTSVNVTQSGKKVEFAKMDISQENITAELMWFVKESGENIIRLGWQVYIIQKTSSDYWLINVDAENKKILGVNNLTVYCDWDNKDHNVKQHSEQLHLNKAALTKQKYPWTDLLNSNTNVLLKNNITTSPSIVNAATYRVVPFPAESPIHPGGTPVLVTNPWMLSGAVNNATTLKWHSIGTNNFDITRGNNVWAQEDQNNNNGTSATQVTSTTTPDPLTFDFLPDFLLAPTVTTPSPNQQFNTTNLFYWNNITHDLTYQYGFDEPARNFQGDNMGRGGNQNDFVFADAQDGGGTNNANFSTPPDGASGRMQMYIWTPANPNRDGDVDNGIIVHEYAHGISNRLTGNGSSCLQNAEQMGEGWSDYYSLMYTQDWATATLSTGFNSPRGIGTYVINQPITGPGIRSQRYTTNFAINNKVYAASIPAESHDRGEIWCAVLWEMTWGIINQIGTINPNLFNANAAGGNSVALKLVTEGLKLQPCSPGFISSRDAILQADMILYGGIYRCTILEAFRKRGMGLGASQGSSASVTDQIPSFINAAAPIVLLQGGITSLIEGQNINYSNRITTDVCAGITGYTITDTLPLNVTYVSGGSYDAATRVVSFPVTQAPGTTINYNFVVNLNPGTYFPPVNLLNETVPASMPASWTPITTVPAGGNLWTISTLQSNSAPNAFFCENEVISTDKRLELTNGILLPTGMSVYNKLNFWHKFNTEDGWDGGVVEISTNGGSTWTDLGSNFLTNKYNSTLGAGTGNNLSNRDAFTGLISSFINSTINLTPFAGQTVKIRFRFASDDNTAGTGTPTGWFVDDVNITNAATVSMRASFFNASMVRLNFADTAMLILQNTNSAPIITAQPSNTTVCSGNTATFSSTAAGASNTYSWEVSTNGGTIWAAVTPAATTTTLTLTAVTIAMNGNLYRLKATNPFGSVNSNGALLTVTATPSAPIVNTPVTYCQGAVASALTASGSNILWYTFPTGGTGSSTAPTPSTTTVGTTNYYVTQTMGSCESQRSLIAVTINATPVAPSVISPISYCQNSPTVQLTATGTNLLWYSGPSGGTGSTTAPTPSSATIGSTIYYVSQTTGSCEGPRASITVNITVSTAAPTVTSPITYCQNSTAVSLTATGSNLLWYVASTGGIGSATAPIPSTTTVGAFNYFVTQTTNCGESQRATIVVNINITPSAPIVNSAINYCQGSTASALTATGTNLMWYSAATGGLGSNIAPTPLTTTTGSVSYYVSQKTGNCEGPRATITVNITSAPSITVQPLDITSCTTTATFNVTANGTGLTYQWQISTDAGSTYNNITSATANAVTISGLTVAQANNKYRVIVSSGSCTAAISNSVTAKVGIPPSVVLTAAPTVNFNPTTTGGLYVTISPVGNYTYQWKRNNVVLPMVASSSITKANGLLDEFGIYQVTAFDVATGCFGVSNTVSVSDITSYRNRLFVSPNPTRGLVKISYYSTSPATQARMLSIYDSKGAILLTKTFSVSGNYGFIDLNLTAYPEGSYMLILRDAAGNKIASERIIKN